LVIVGFNVFWLSLRPAETDPLLALDTAATARRMAATEEDEEE